MARAAPVCLLSSSSSIAMSLRCSAVAATPSSATFSTRARRCLSVWLLARAMPSSLTSSCTVSDAPDAICSLLPAKGSRLVHTASSLSSPYAPSSPCEATTPPRPCLSASAFDASSAAMRSLRIEFVALTASPACCSTSLSLLRRSASPPLLAPLPLPFSSRSMSGHSLHSALSQSHGSLAACLLAPSRPRPAGGARAEGFETALGPLHTGSQQSSHPKILTQS
mmetsp:Transcript_6615/g.12840  ORF Transcript_6615/g.12840 Transcript_6615/m.12840 type:complete len:224 (+) Transcript_6615:27-698(+)